MAHINNYPFHKCPNRSFDTNSRTLNIAVTEKFHISWLTQTDELIVGKNI